MTKDNLPVLGAGVYRFDLQFLKFEALESGLRAPGLGFRSRIFASTTVMIPAGVQAFEKPCAGA